MPDAPHSASPRDDADWDALGRYAAGESDPAEVARVAAWLASHPADAALIRLVQEPATVSALRAPIDVEAALARVRARAGIEAGTGVTADGDRVAPIGAPALTVHRGGAPRAARAVTVDRGGRRWRSVAAAAAVIAVAYTGWSQWRGDAGPATPATPAVHATAIGERSTINLADGSRVELAPGSRLTVAADFATSRVVELQGAAFFQVQHDDEHPFTVRSGHAEIRDIGTGFSVSTDVAGDVVVMVTEGVVALRRVPAAGAARAADTAAVELQAGDRGILAARDMPAVVSRGTVTDADVAWTRGSLVYRDTPLATVQADLRRWYGVELHLADSALARRTITASFGAAQLPADSVAQVLRTIALVLGAEVTRTGDAATLRLVERQPTR